MDTTRKTVVVAGSSGFVGSALVPRLRRRGYDVRTLVRRPVKAPGEITWDPGAGQLPSDALDGAQAVVNLAGVGVGDHRWTDSYREQILRSRVDSTTLLSERLVAAVSAGSAPAEAVLVQASAIGAYGDQGDTVLTESSPFGEGFLADVVRAWEAAAEPARAAGLRVAHLRTGIVLAPSGGALGRLLPLVKAGVAGPMGSGDQFWSWISLEDEIRAILHIMESDLEGPVNLTAPAPSRNADLTRALGDAFGRPTKIKVPAFALKIALGEFSSELLGSQRVHPEVLERAGFEFTHPTIHAAARWVAQGRPAQTSPTV